MNKAATPASTAVFMDPGLRRDDGGCRDDGWGEALGRLERAQAALDAGRNEEDEDFYDALLDVHSDALCAFLALPAPDLRAIAVKLDHIVPQLAWELTGSEDCLERLRQNAHRLATSAG